MGANPVPRMENVRGGTARAPRYQVELAVQYRPVRAFDWHPGLTANVSRSGVLFETEQQVEPDALIELNLKMPLPVFHKGETSVVCLGRVVRVAEPVEQPARKKVAATIVSYYFVRGDAVSDA
jgi:hypothetical protein